MFLDMFTYALPAHTHTSGKQSKKAVKIFAPICVSKKKNLEDWILFWCEYYSLFRPPNRDLVQGVYSLVLTFDMFDSQDDHVIIIMLCLHGPNVLSCLDSMSIQANLGIPWLQASPIMVWRCQVWNHNALGTILRAKLWCSCRMVLELLEKWYSTVPGIHYQDLWSWLSVSGFRTDV